MKEVLVQSYCDLHEDGERVAATTEVTHNGRMLDVCEQHQRRIESLVRRLDDLFSVGVEVETSSPPPRRRQPSSRVASQLKDTIEWRTCQDCGYVCPTRSALGQHVKQKHDRILADYTWPTSIRA